MTDLRCTIRRRDGSVTTIGVTLPVYPSAWSADDVEEFPWAVIRLLEAPAVYRVSPVEVELARSWRIEVPAATGFVVTRAMPLSSSADVWLCGAVFKMPGLGVH